MLKLVFAQPGDDTFKAVLGSWVKKRTFMVRTLRQGDYEVIGVLNSPRGDIVAGVLYHDYAQLGDGGKIEISMAADSPRWAQKGIIRALLHYPFIQLNCHVVICTTNRSNKRTRKFLEGIGFEERGTIPNRPYSDDTVIYCLRREKAMEKGWVEVSHEEVVAA